MNNAGGRIDCAFGYISLSFSFPFDSSPSTLSYRLAGCGFNWLYWELIAGLEGHLIRLVNRAEKWGHVTVNSPSSCSISPRLKVRCNKIATAGIINEAEWARREGLISYLWDANQLATSLTVLLMIFSGPQAIPSPARFPLTCSCPHASLSTPTPPFWPFLS